MKMMKSYWLAYDIPIWLRSLAAAEVAEGPRSVAQHAQLPAVSEKLEERREGPRLKHKVPAHGAVASNVTERPNGLLSYIRLMTAQKLDEDGDGARIDDNLGLSSGSRGDVGQGPGGLELDEGMRRSKELDEARNDTSLDDLLDRRIALLAEEFAELCSGLDLLFRVV